MYKSGFWEIEKLEQRKTSICVCTVLQRLCELVFAKLSPLHRMQRGTDPIGYVVSQPIGSLVSQPIGSLRASRVVGAVRGHWSRPAIRDVGVLSSRVVERPDCSVD